jgi:uncharacterized protein (TIGR03083 family)
VSTLAERTVSALRARHDHLARRAGGLPAQVLSGPSGAADWTVAQVLSHLGSGAEIATAVAAAARAGDPVPGQEFNQGVWDRWNALGAAEQAAGFVERNDAFVALVESLSPAELDGTRVDLGFLPAPLPLPSFLGMRLNEATLHGWDVDVAVDPDAELHDATAATLAEHLADGLGFLLAFASQPAKLAEPAVVAVAGSPYALVIGDQVRLTASAPAATATFSGSLGAALRLLAGRLKPDYTPPDVNVQGNVTLDELRVVFPGY